MTIVVGKRITSIALKSYKMIDTSSEHDYQEFELTLTLYNLNTGITESRSHDTADTTV